MRQGFQGEGRSLSLGRLRDFAHLNGVAPHTGIRPRLSTLPTLDTARCSRRCYAASNALYAGSVPVEAS